MLAPQTYPPVRQPPGVRATPQVQANTAPAGAPPAAPPAGAPPAAPPAAGLAGAPPNGSGTGTQGRQGSTGSAVVNPQDGLAPGTMVSGGDGGAKAYFQKLLGDDGPAQGDTSPLTAQQSQAIRFQQQARAGLVSSLADPNKAPNATWTPVNTSQIDPVRQQQQQAISMLQSAANGSAPSAAELQQQQAGNRAAAQQFGMASALQGGLSPGAALRQASEGAANLQADTANNNAQLRAGEMSNARGQLVQGLAGVRGQEQDLAGQNAGLAQQTALANLNSQLTTTGQNQDWSKALLNAQSQGLASQTQGATGLANANTQNAAAANQYNSGYIQQGKKFVSNLFGL